MIAYIICMNDRTEAVVLNNEGKALAEMKKLSDEYYERNKWNFKSKDEYEHMCYWHLHEVRVI